MGEKILLATKNQNKIKELKTILNNFNFEVVSLNDLCGIKEPEEPEETGKTFAENSSLKAKYYGDCLKMSAIADDSGLCVDELNNFPSIYSSRLNNNNKDYNYSFNVIKLLLEYNNIEDYSAHFVCNISFYNYKNKSINSFEGNAYGKLKFPASGENGFGYDPIFIPDGYLKSFAEIEAEEKNKISHRVKAIEKLTKWFELKTIK